jgi:hypothetical protein
MGARSPGEFLNSAGATVLTGFSHLNDTLNNTIFDIQGSILTGLTQTFSVSHDDGITLLGSRNINCNHLNLSYE